MMRSTLAATVAVAILAAPAVATAGGGSGRPDRRERSFDRIAHFPVYLNNADPSAETVAEIVDVSRDGRTLVYTDSLQDQIGFVDITDPGAPQPAGTLAVGGEPTSVSVAGRHALVAVSTSESFVAPSGFVAVVDIAERAVVAELPLAGQPDSVKVSPDRRYAAVVLENERDEDVVVDGVEGGLPQPPAGALQIVDLVGRPSNWGIRTVRLTGLADYAPDDPEPEFVDVDDRNRAVITLQENNHLVVVNLRTGRIISEFSAGTVDLDGIDTVEDGVIDLTGSLTDVPREPDGVAWIGGNRFATANEGDLFGGSRGFSVFAANGSLRFDSGNEIEELAVRYGHYPEDRSENKGTEPEGVEYAEYGRERFLFVGAERGNFIAVYRLTERGEPEFAQLLPTGIGPEGLLAIPGRDLLVATSEVDDPPVGVRTNITIYALGERGAPPEYPDVVSEDGPGGTPLPWSALSGLAADPQDPAHLYAVWDSYYAQSRIFSMDVSADPAVITSSTIITGGSGDYDPEGIALAPDGTTWIASEGNASDSRTNRLLQVDDDGAVIAEVRLPEEILACRAATTNRGSLGAGFEGVAVLPGVTGDYRLAVAQQRGWDYTTPQCEALDDDTAGANEGEPSQTRIWLYDPATRAWTSVPYALEPVPEGAAWVGLSEIVALADGDVALIERDNLTGAFSALKWLTRVEFDDTITRSDKVTFDLLPPLRSADGWITDKPEGFTVAADGEVYVVTDNDGVEGWSGETQFLQLGQLNSLLPEG